MYIASFFEVILIIMYIMYHHRFHGVVYAVQGYVFFTYQKKESIVVHLFCSIRRELYVNLIVIPSDSMISLLLSLTICVAITSPGQ